MKTETDRLKSKTEKKPKTDTDLKNRYRPSSTTD